MSTPEGSELSRIEREIEIIGLKREVAETAGGETILLVEDESLLWELAITTLETHGYQVLAARDGEEALRRCEAHAGPIHLLLTDVVLPGMNGRLVADRIAALRPGIRVLFMSGYTDDAGPSPAPEA